LATEKQATILREHVIAVLSHAAGEVDIVPQPCPCCGTPIKDDSRVSIKVLFGSTDEFEQWCQTIQHNFEYWWREERGRKEPTR